MMTFSSGLAVLHTPYYHPRIFSARLVRQLSPAPIQLVDSNEQELDSASNKLRRPEEKGLTTIEIAVTEGLSVGLAKEMVETIERQIGSIVRDEQGGETGGGERWFRNLMVGWRVEDI